MSDILERRKQAAERQRQQRPVTPGRPTKVQLIRAYLDRYKLGDDPPKEAVIRLNQEAEQFADTVLRNSDVKAIAAQAVAAEERRAQYRQAEQQLVVAEARRLLKAAGGDKVAAAQALETLVSLRWRIAEEIRRG